MTVIAASFADFKLIKGRKVCQLVCEVPLEKADAALAALGGLPNPHAERWVAIAPLIEQPQGIDSGSASPVADAEGSPASAPDWGSTPVALPPAVTPKAQARGAAEPATKPKKHWDDLSPSQQAGIACERYDFQVWLVGRHFRTSNGGAINCGGPGPDHAAIAVRHVCGVQSRADLDTNPEAAKRWRELYGRFTADTTYGERR